MGACAGDYDNDGWIDLYVTNFGPNVLYRNRGDGSFIDVTTAARVGDPRWSASCAFADLDKDGDLDLFVVNYVDADRRKTPYCGNATLGQRFYLSSAQLPPAAEHALSQRRTRRLHGRQRRVGHRRPSRQRPRRCRHRL